MDEFANVSLPDDFDKLLATMRSRKISVSIIIQNIAQLTALYEKQWESIMGNCDEFLYLGGNETSTHKLISENYLGKSTLWLDTPGTVPGTSGSHTRSSSGTGPHNQGGTWSALSLIHISITQTAGNGFEKELGAFLHFPVVPAESSCLNKACPSAALLCLFFF